MASSLQSSSSYIQVDRDQAPNCHSPKSLDNQTKVFVEIIRQNIFYSEGTSLDVTVAVTNLSEENRSFHTTVTSYPYELRSSPVHIENEERTDEIASKTTFCFEHEFFASWDGRWSFNATSTGTDLTGSRALVSGNGTGDIKVHPLPTRLADDANKMTRDLVLFSTIAAVVGPAIAASAVIVSSIQTRFLLRSPKLEIVWDPEKNRNLHEPALTVKLVDSGTECGKPVSNEANARYVERKHLRVIVRNTGAKLAKDCTASIRLLSKDSGCKASSFEPKPLRWVSPVGDVAHKTDIAPNGGEQYLEVFFADDCVYAKLENLGCGIDSKDCSLRAYVSAPLTYRKPWNFNQDGFCRGKFTVLLKLYGDDSRPVSMKFQLEVTDDWRALSMKSIG